MASDSLPYPLKRNALASTRLNFNHFWMKGITGYLLHPEIPTEKDNLRIADVGTGTGIWAGEIAVQLPDAKIDAIDISAAQFPPAPFRKSNTHFWTHDCFKPFPDEYLGQFDIVHARFWLCIINDDVAKPLMENLLTLLKPGGYLQWMEPLPRTAYVLARNGGAPTPACDKLVKTWDKPTPRSSYDWVHALPQLFEELKLEVLVEEKHENSQHYLPVGAQTVLLGLSEYLYANPNIEEYIEQLAGEHAAGAYVDVKWTCVVSRKTI
ncbi:S-adenosyl-L-methionine-dependent methyltransferase [Massariosphaeria phaeospora]|uniref:S-adenosyl-L-methionine-dependent methyltransferase n=1 Tax=Massariosphaeria phaeospora TaxID=100035 RepID=A0A7C8I2L6_9PLEO|nr:S-adenosyl-L-methionine-dependent methyltransferase [Massariosphaeria phaeospora]